MSQVQTGSIRRYANAEATGIADHLRRFLGEAGVDQGEILGACAAGAGPVDDGAVRLTNLDWRVGPEELREVLSTPHVAVLNDLQAQGHALGGARADDVEVLVEGSATDAQATKLVVGIGTGFNAAPVYETRAGRMVAASEAGHISLPEIGKASERLVAFLQAEFGFASVEEALSGRGISQVHQALHGETKSAQEIMAALDAGEVRARETLRLVVQLLGAVVGDLALVTLPFGGIFLVGGVARNLAPWFETFGFADAMQAKGRFDHYLQQFSVSLVSDDYAALTGCAAYLARI